jgi:putative transcriptional regulator
MKAAFDKIAAGLEDAMAYAEGDRARARVATVDVKAVRERTKLSQDRFADAYRLPVATLRDWEQSRRTPDTGSMLYLKLIQADPEAVQRLLAKVD